MKDLLSKYIRFVDVVFAVFGLFMSLVCILCVVYFFLDMPDCDRLMGLYICAVLAFFSAFLFPVSMRILLNRKRGDGGLMSPISLAIGGCFLLLLSYMAFSSEKNAGQSVMESLAPYIFLVSSLLAFGTAVRRFVKGLRTKREEDIPPVKYPNLLD